MKNKPLLFHLLLCTVGSLQASTLYWNNGTADTNWTDAGNWTTDVGGTSAASAAPTSADDVVFNTTSLNSTVISMRANTSGLGFKSATFDNASATTITGTGNQNLTFYSGGLTSNVGAGAVTLGTATSSRNIFVKFQESQTWTNHSSSTVNIRNNGAASDTATSDVVLTFNTTGSGAISNSGGFSDGTSGHKLSLVVDSSGTGSVSLNGGSYSGGTTVKRGLLIQNGSSQMGTGGVKLGDTSGSNTATLRINTTTIQTSALNVQSGNSGANQLQFGGSTTGEWSGDVALNNALSVQVRGGSTGTISGDLTGTGSLTKEGYTPSVGNGGTLIMSGDLSYAGNTTINSGIFQLASAGSMTFFIGENGVNNKLTGTATVQLDGTIVFNLANAAAVSGNSWQIVNVGTLNESYGSNFKVNGFTTEGDGLWTNNAGYVFSQGTGLLTYTVPEPTSCVLAAGGVVLLGLRRRRVG